jgi:hypothetical protein
VSVVGAAAVVVVAVAAATDGVVHCTLFLLAVTIFSVVVVVMECPVVVIPEVTVEEIVSVMVDAMSASGDTTGAPADRGIVDMVERVTFISTVAMNISNSIGIKKATIVPNRRIFFVSE